MHQEGQAWMTTSLGKGLFAMISRAQWCLKLHKGEQRKLEVDACWLKYSCALTMCSFWISFVQFGLCYPDVNYPDSKNTIECNFVMKLADDYLMSWTYWDTNAMWNANGTLNENVASFFARPYPSATAGIPLKASFQSTTCNKKQSCFSIQKDVVWLENKRVWLWIQYQHSRKAPSMTSCIRLKLLFLNAISRRWIQD